MQRCPHAVEKTHPYDHCCQPLKIKIGSNGRSVTLFSPRGPERILQSQMAARGEGGKASEATNTLILLNRHHILSLLCFLSAAIGSSGFRMHNHDLGDTRKRPGMLCFSSWPWALRATGTGATGSKASRSRPAPIFAMSDEMGHGQQESQPLTVGSIIKEWEEVRIRARPPHHHLT